MNSANKTPTEKSLNMPVMNGWHDFVKSKDRSSLQALLHSDVVFESPVLHTPQHGREITMKYLVAGRRERAHRSRVQIHERMAQ